MSLWCGIGPAAPTPRRGEQEMIDEADRDGDGVINEEEFYRVMRKRENPLDEIDSDDDF